MKGYRMIWFLSFITSLAAIAISVFVFLMFIRQDNAEITDNKKQQNSVENITEEEYYEPQDNVGAVTFTEDQITELARNIFSYDDYLKDVNVEFEENKISISAKISDADNLIKTYPELTKYKSVITSLEDKKLSVNGTVKNTDGRASIGIDSVSVGGMEIDGAIISPFIENDDFSELFDVEFENIELTKDAVVFKNGVPDILKY